MASPYAGHNGPRKRATTIPTTLKTLLAIAKSPTAAAPENCEPIRLSEEYANPLAICSTTNSPPSRARSRIAPGSTWRRRGSNSGRWRRNNHAPLSNTATTPTHRHATNHGSPDLSESPPGPRAVHRLPWPSAMPSLETHLQTQLNPWNYTNHDVE